MEGAQGLLSSFKASVGLDEPLWKLESDSLWRIDGSPQRVACLTQLCVCVHVHVYIKGTISSSLPRDVGLYQSASIGEWSAGKVAFLIVHISWVPYCVIYNNQDMEATHVH